VDSGTVRVFSFLFGSVVAGTVWFNGGGGGEGGNPLFFLLSLVAVSFLGGWMSAVGFLCYIFRFSSVNLWIFLAVLCFERY
jgi:hypothetical protein